MRGKVVLIVMDGVGVGAAPDAAAYGDVGSNSIGNTAKELGGLELPTLGRLGLGNLTHIEGTPAVTETLGCYAKVEEISAGKDSTTGHWEMCGIVTEKPFPTYPKGFPPDVLAPFEAAVGRAVLGNRAASGTVIIQELGDEHVRTGRPIVYTSADSVFQIATHEEVVPVEQLYEWCAIARSQLVGEHNLGRVIARPFAGTSGSFKRTPRRRDYTVRPPKPSLLDTLVRQGHEVIGIGKIEDLFSGVGISQVDHTTSNEAGMCATCSWYDQSPDGSLLFTNLNDFDTLWGHRNDVQGYANGLRAFDAWLPELLGRLTADDLLLVTSDHGNDPTTAGTDHSREYVPLLAMLGKGGRGATLGVRQGLIDIAATVMEHFGLRERFGGRSFRTQMGAA